MKAVVRAPSRDRRGRAVRSGETAAWLVVLPGAALTIAVVVLLGPALGGVLAPARPTFTFWDPSALHPQPEQMGRFVLSLLGPLVLSAGILAIVHRQPLLPAQITTATVVTAQMLVVAVVVAAFIGQHQSAFARSYFTDKTLVVSGLLAVMLLALSRSGRLRDPLRRVLRESRARRGAALAAAVLLTAIWLLHAVNDDASVSWAIEETRYHLPFHLDETFALLNGLTPLVTFTPQYGVLWPYVVAVPMLALGETLLVFSIAMCTISALAFLAIFGVFRRVTQSSVAALLLFLPFLATSLFVIREAGDGRHTFGSYFAMFPLRFAGPYLLMWMAALALARPAGRRSWLLFGAGGLVLINNIEFGVAAFGATIAALLWTIPRVTPRALLRLAGHAAVGLGVAIAIVSLLTLAHGGALPQPERLTEFARIYGRNGFNAIPIPGLLGLPLVIYCTHVAAIATATVLATKETPDRILVGMLAWSGVFGLGSAAYYVSRAHADVLPYLFSPWAISLALLAVVTLRRFAQPTPLRRSAIGVTVLFGIGLTACSLAQLQWPQTQLERIREVPPTGPTGESLAPPEEPEIRRFVSSVADGPDRFVVRRGVPVANLATTGHRIADAYGMRNVSPYTGYDSVNSAEQLDAVLDALREAGGNTLISMEWRNQALNRALTRRGFEVVTVDGLRRWPSRESEVEAQLLNELPVSGQFIKWVDTHHLRAEALR